MICIVALALSSCSKKSASNRSTRSDADTFFEKPTIQEYKRMCHGTIAGFDQQGGRCIEYASQEGTDFSMADSRTIRTPHDATRTGHDQVGAGRIGHSREDQSLAQAQLNAQNKSSTYSSISSGTSKQLSVEQYKQKLLDIPLPVDARAVAQCTDYMTTNELSLSRHTSLSQQELLDFYTSMLEQSGWRLIGVIKGSSESLMTWEKPRKLCIVSLRPVRTKNMSKRVQQTRIVINVCEKKKYS